VRPHTHNNSHGPACDITPPAHFALHAQMPCMCHMTLLAPCNTMVATEAQDSGTSMPEAPGQASKALGAHKPHPPHHCARSPAREAHGMRGKPRTAPSAGLQQAGGDGSPVRRSQRLHLSHANLPLPLLQSLHCHAPLPKRQDGQPGHELDAMSCRVWGHPHKKAREAIHEEDCARQAGPTRPDSKRGAAYVPGVCLIGGGSLLHAYTWGRAHASPVRVLLRCGPRRRCRVLTAGEDGALLLPSRQGRRARTNAPSMTHASHHTHSVS